jgi:hypothetical protein
MLLAMDDLDTRVRLKAFSFIEELSFAHRDALPRELLATGFDFEQTRVRLIGPQGIFKPAILQVPISITTVPIIEGKARPYDDEIGNDGLINRSAGPCIERACPSPELPAPGSFRRRRSPFAVVLS